jgi:hypothetical protein
MIRFLWNTANQLLEKEALSHASTIDILETYIEEALNRSHLSIHAFANRDETYNDIMTQVRDMFESSDPLMANRRALADSINTSACYFVLNLTTGARHRYWIADNPLISGELSHFIPQIIEANPVLERALGQLKQHPEQFLEDAISDGLHIENLRLVAFLTIRNSLGDYSADNKIRPDISKDWFLPCYESSAACWEDRYRNRIGLPSLLTEHNAYDMGPEALVAYSGFTELVRNGKGDPLRAWQRKCEQLVSLP